MHSSIHDQTDLFTARLCAHLWQHLMHVFMAASSVTIAGAPLDRDRLYHVTTKAYLALGRDGYTVFAQGKVRVWKLGF